MADYTTAAKVKALGRLNIEGTDYDTALGQMITAASRWVDQYAGQGIEDAFTATAEVERYYDPLTEVVAGLLCLDAPLLSLTTLTNGDGTTIPTAGAVLFPRNRPPYRQVRLTLDYAWSFLTQDSVITVEGVWGITTTCPAPVDEATAILAGWLFKRYQNALADATANVVLGELFYTESLPKPVIALLQPWRGVPTL